MLIPRSISGHLKKMVTKFPVVSLTGPRQSGKTTLLKSEFPEYRYFNLELLNVREIISADPLGFLTDTGPMVIFDEAQRLPELFSFIQVVSDERNINGQYILSGSQSFLLNEHISQSLAGRVSINNLFPFDISELNSIREQKPDLIILNGFYPRVHDQNIEPQDFYPSYLQTYIERDIRNIKAVENLQTFSRFLSLCAGRIGQILNLTSLANDAGISVNTAKAWLSLLESSFIIFLLQPYYRNFNKRIIKSPKLYFYDTGIASSLLRLSKPEDINTHYLYGSLFENLILGEIIKCQVHSGKRPTVYYWRESNGVEIDCIIEKGSDDIIALEIKAGQTFNSDYIKNLRLFKSDLTKVNVNRMLIYAGQTKSNINDIKVLTWQDFYSDAGRMFL